MGRKPYIKKAHVIVEIVSYIILVVAFAVAIYGMNVLDEITTRYKVNGVPDGNGSPKTLLILPLVMLLTNGTISLLMHLVGAKSFNMPVKVKPENAVLVYSDMIWMMVIIQVLIALYTLVTNIGMFFGNGFVITMATIVLLVGLIPAIVVPFVMCLKHNKL